MTIKPFGNNILIEPTKSSAILGESLCEYGTVIAIGDTVTRIAVGDTIGYLTWGIQSLDVDGTRYYLVPCTDEFILATLG